MKKQKGFTLIELLVVIAIIAILSTVVMAGLNSARAKGRDAKRLSDIKQLQSALELFFDSCGGYPSQLRGDILNTDNGTGVGAGATNNGLNPQTAQANNSGTACATPIGTFMNPLPVNPGPNGITYQYCSARSDQGMTVPGGTQLNAGDCDGTSSLSYKILFNLEGQSGSLSGPANHMATPSGII